MRSKCETSSGANNLPPHVHQNAIENAWKNHMFSMESQLVELQSLYGCIGKLMNFPDGIFVPSPWLTQDFQLISSACCYGGFISKGSLQKLDMLRVFLIRWHDVLLSSFWLGHLKRELFSSCVNCDHYDRARWKLFHSATVRNLHKYI